MANDVELENLIVRLTGDSSGLVKSLEESVRAASTHSKAIESATGQMTAAVKQNVAGVEQSVKAATASMQGMKFPMPDTAAIQQTADAARASAGQVGTSMAEAKESLDKVSRSAEEQASKVQGFSGRLESFAKSASGALGTIGIGIGFWKAFEKSEAAEAAAARMNAILEVNGRNVGAVTAEYRNYAGELARTTTLSRGQALGLLEQAESFQVTGAAAQKAVKDAVALAAVNPGQSAESFLMLTAAMARGDTEGGQHMSRLVRQLRGVKDESEFTARYMKLVAAGTQVAGAEADSASGQMEKMKQSLGGIVKNIGDVIMVGMKPLISVVKGVSDSFNSLDGPMRSVVATGLAVTASIVPVVAVSKLVVGAFVSAKVAAVGLSGAFLASPVAMWTAGIAAAAAGTYFLSKTIVNAAFGLNRLNEEMERSKKLSAELNETQRKAIGKLPEQVAAQKPTEQRAFVETRLKSAQKDVEALTAEFAKQQAILDEENDLPAVFLWMDKHLPGGQFDNVKQGVDEVKGRLDTAKERVAALDAEMQKFKVNPALLKQLGELEESTKLKFELVGMDEVGAEIHKLTHKLSPEQLKDPALQDRVNAIQDQAAKVKVAELDQSVRQLSDSLVEQADTFGLTGHQMEIYKLQSKGASDAQLEFARDMAKQLEGLEVGKAASDLAKSFGEQAAVMNMTGHAAELYRLQMKGATEGQLAAARGAAEHLTAMEALKATFDAGKQTIEQFKLPETALSDRMAELNKQFQASAIDMGTYNRAVDAAEEQFRKATMGANDLKGALQGIQGVSAGSAEALSRVNAQADMMAEQRRMQLQVGASANALRMTAPFVGPTAAGLMPQQGPTPFPSAPAPMQAVQAVGPGGGIADKNEILEVLKEIRDDQRERNRKGTLEIKKVGLW